MKSFTWRILLHTLPVLAALGIVAWATNDYLKGQGGYKLGVDLVGGTILVYEVDPSKKLPENYRPEDLASALKRRIDPANLYDVTIRPIGENRIEVILPTGGRAQSERAAEAWKEVIEKARDYVKLRYQAWYKDGPPLQLEGDIKAAPGQGDVLFKELKEQLDEALKKLRASGSEKPVPEGAPVSDEELRAEITSYIDANKKKFLTSEDVKEIKELIRRVGALEFRILANVHNDKAAIDAIEANFKDVLTDPARKDFLETLAIRGEAPPINPDPTTANKDKPSFETPLPGPDGRPLRFTYSWVELSQAMRHQFGLDNASEASDGPNWVRAKTARDKGETFRIGDNLLWSRKSQNLQNPQESDEKRYEYFILTRESQPGKKITGEFLTSASEGVDSRNQLAVNFRFDSAGATLFRDLTSANKPVAGGDGKAGFETQLAIILDGLVMSAPSIRTTISGDGQITGNFSPVEVERLVKVLRAGALPATLLPQPVSESTISPTLGEQTVYWGSVSVGLAFLAVLVFMIVYYRFAGLVACVALLANLVLTVAFMVVVKATFTLPGLAGLVLMLGMAVDANVLIYERLREERDKGASLALAIRNGYDRAFPAIIDTHLTSIFTAVVLYVVGNDQLKGFGITLASGLIISLWTSLFMTRAVFDIGLAWGWIKQLRMMRLLTNVNINFMAIRKVMFTVTVLLTILGTVVFVYRIGSGGLNIDFVGGTAYRGELAKAQHIEELRKLLGDEAQKQKLQVKGVKDLSNPPRQMEYEVTYTDPDYKRTILLSKPLSEADLIERLRKLPDWSVEQTYDANAPAGTVGSTKFNIRTTEKEAEIVLAAIDRLLGDHLKKIDFDVGKIEVNTKEAGNPLEATLEFFVPGTEPREKAFASPTTIRQQVLAALVENNAADAGKIVEVKAEPDAEDRARADKKSSRMVLVIPEAAGLSRERLEKEVLPRLKEMVMHQPEPEAIENFDKALAGDMQQRALWAILASWGAILLFLWFRFGNWTFGAAAVACLVHDLLLVLGIIGACHYLHEYVPWLASALLIQDFKIDLAAVAALLTLVGFSVNDTIVVFDRIREVRGKSPELTYKTINDSVNQTLSRTILTSFITWLVVAVLYVFGGEGVHLFAFVMVVGVIVGTYSSIYIAAPLLITFGEGRRGGQPVREESPQAATAE